MWIFIQTNKHVPSANSAFSVACCNPLPFPQAIQDCHEYTVLSNTIAQCFREVVVEDANCKKEKDELNEAIKLNLNHGRIEQF